MSITESVQTDRGGVVATEQLPRAAAALASFTFGSVLLATLLSPDFGWYQNALSNLGTTTTDAGTTTTFVVFNGGLLVGSLAGLALILDVYRRVDVVPTRAVATLGGVTLTWMGLIAVFPQGTPPHYPVSVGFFLTITVAIWADAVTSFRAGAGRWSLVALAGGAANLLTWVLWIATDQPAEAVAIPEIIGAFIFGVWFCTFTARVARDR